MSGRRFAAKHVLVGAAEARAAGTVLATGQLHGRSPAVQEFESQLAGWFGTASAVAVNSGTTAIELALMAVGVTRDDEVLVPATATVMTALPILRLGARPVFVDTEPLSFTPSLTGPSCKSMVY